MATDRKNKKKFIALLLLASCIAAAYLLYHYPASTGKNINDLAEADSLIHKKLAAFSIPDSQITERLITVDTVLSRKNYYVLVPPGFSKTELHAELSRTLQPYGITAPAKVIFPQKDLLIQLLYNDTVIRSIRVQTDPELEMIQNPASILVAFDGKPAEDLLNEIISLGEPISIVLKVDDAVQAQELQQELGGRYPHISFWLQEDSPEERRSSDRESILPKLQHLREVTSEAPILSMKSSDPMLESISHSGLDIINISDAHILGEETDRATFKKVMDEFEQQARKRRHPVAIVSASRETLRWLDQELNDLKKGGLYLTLPTKTTY